MVLLDEPTNDHQCVCDDSCEFPCAMRPGVTGPDAERCATCGCGEPIAEDSVMSTGIETYEDLARDVHAHQGVLTVSMGRLRTISGSQRLGKHLRQQILHALQNVGLDVGPNLTDLPSSHLASVRVYDPKSHVGQLIDAAVHIGEPHDQMLRKIDRHGGAAKLKAIRTIISE